MGAGSVCLQRQDKCLVVRVGRQEEGVNSLRPELAAVARTLQAAARVSTMDHPHIQNVVHMARQRREASVHVVKSRQESNAQEGSYDSGEYDATWLQRAQQQLVVMMANALESASQGPAAHISMMTEDELRLVSHTWAHRAGEVGHRDLTLQQLLEQALSTADRTRTAIENPLQGLKLSYEQLDAATARVA
jgi:hypothetical protein